MTPDAHMVETLRLRTAALHRVIGSNDLLRRENDDLRARLARALDDLRALQVDDAMRDLCHHCGQAPEADGDHSCPCPHTDSDCPNHPPNGTS